VVALARQPNVSLAAVALANELNANMLRRWVREAEAAGGESRSLSNDGVPTFIQLPMHAAPSVPVPAPEPVPERIQVEIHRNGATIRASLPMDSRSAAWLREVAG
jgi:transposase